MLNRDDGRYLNAWRRRTAETRNAIVTASLGGNRYTVTLIDTGGEIKATNNTTDTITAGMVVLVRLDTTGRATNRLPQIIGIPRDTANGLITTTTTTTTSRTGEVVTSWPEYPVPLYAGGDPSDWLSIRGVRLATAPTYGSADVDDYAAAEVDDTLIRFQVAASEFAGAGNVSLTAGGVTVPDFFAVSAPPDDFLQNADGVPTGYTSFQGGNDPPTLAVDTDTLYSHLRLSRASHVSGKAWAGIWKAAPAMPFIVTAEITSVTMGAASHVGMFGTRSGDGFSDTTFAFYVWKDGTTYKTHVGGFSNAQTEYANPTQTELVIPSFPAYLRMIVSQVGLDIKLTCQAYLSGAWTTAIADWDVGFAGPETLSAVGLGINSDNADTVASFDWLRFRDA